MKPSPPARRSCSENPFPVSDWLALARFFAKGRGEQEEMGQLRSPFREQWQTLRAKHPEVFTVSADEIDAWHRHEAWRCESRKDWSNAVHHLTELLKTQPDSGDFLPRRAAAYVAWAENVMAGVSPAVEPGVPPGGTGVGTKGVPETFGAAATTTANPGGKMPPSTAGGTPAATEMLERVLRDYSRTLAWVDRFPAIAKESRLPFVEKRREIHLKLGRTAEAEADGRELKAGVQK